ncbi:MULTISPECIES: TetR/AcrR family transcriptional regulator [unclassified Pseudofrankia]|uniref:TetR/AcrR family transcriptional regulator n=1 Tax=unclassified Pseudofrankia TaxID=2994372 RepID=UPI0009F49C6B|nr:MULTISPECIES: TetR/AcrR family transcriptional regulator [unclassified Pseudofrankia]MDT3446850.1 TetR/AcrR family transcriptional regulator [Pseudofrankia sp. BMG5.37]
MKDGGSLSTRSPSRHRSGISRGVSAEENQLSPASTQPCSQAGRSSLQRRRHNSGEGYQLRAEITRAAMRLLETTPSSKLTLRAVAREAGISAPAIYLQFSGRQEMILHIANLAWRELAAEMEHADGRVQNDEPYKQLQAQIRAYLHYALASKTRYELLFGVDPGIELEMDDERLPTRPVYITLRRVIERCREAGYVLQLDSLDDMTVLVFSVAHGNVALAHAMNSPLTGPAQIHSYVDRVLCTLVTAPPEAIGKGR